MAKDTAAKPQSIPFPAFLLAKLVRYGLMTEVGKEVMDTWMADKPGYPKGDPDMKYGMHLEDGTFWFGEGQPEGT